MVKIAIFASGGGSNARQIITHFSGSSDINVALVVTNNPDAGVLDIAASENIETVIISKNDLNTGQVTDILINHQIDIIVLAGFLWLIPAGLIKAFDQRILNIHPSLLPKYGGKGMFGHFVHEAVKNNNETESGMTIHLVNDHYDKGQILFQATCSITPDMTAEEIAAKVLSLEHQHYSLVIENFIRNNFQNKKAT